MKTRNIAIATLAALTAMTIAPCVVPVSAATTLNSSPVIAQEAVRLQRPFINTVSKSYQGYDGVKLTFAFNDVEGVRGIANGYEAGVSRREVGAKTWNSSEVVDANEFDDDGFPIFTIVAPQDYEFAVKIRAYYEINGKRYYSDWSDTAYGDTRMPCSN